MSLHPVIIAGGSGTRFWPLSRASRPKQFLALASERPLIVDTAQRLKGLASVKDFWVVCGKAHAPGVRKLLKGLRPARLLVEPVARNTAPAIALAAAQVYAKDRDGIIVVLPADHHIANPAAFRDCLAQAADVAQDGAIVTVGIRPTQPETGYGYIRVGDPLTGDVRKVAAFVEKPNLDTARSYLASGNYVWNGGIFVFRADVMLEALAKHMPALSAQLDQVRKAIGKKTYAKVLAKAFAKMPNQSIDYGVMEKADHMAVVPGDFGWSDVGSFAAMSDVRTKDARGNVVSGKGALVLDCDRCTVVAKDKPVAVVGLSDIVVVDAGDAFLVIPASKSQEVRQVVEALKAKKLTKFV